MNSKIVVLNSELVDYDGKMDYSMIGEDVTIYRHSEADEIIERIQGAEIIVTKELVLPESLIKQFPDSVKCICEAGTGFNNIDLKAADERDLTVCNIPAYSTQRVAQTAIMMMLNLSSQVQKQVRMIERGCIDNFSKHLMVDHTEINDKVLGIIGYGSIGREVIKIAQALGMKILVYTRTQRENIGDIEFTTLENVLRQCDYLSLHCPLTEQTRHIINADTLALIKPEAFIINTSRGALIDEQALIQALKEEKLAGAGLDVQEHEPLSADSELFKLDNVLVTPHMGWKGFETRQRLLKLLAKNIQAYQNGSPINVVNQK